MAQKRGATGSTTLFSAQIESHEVRQRLHCQPVPPDPSISVSALVLSLTEDGGEGRTTDGQEVRVVPAAYEALVDELVQLAL